MEPSIWVIDREHWPRACLRAELIERGFDAIGFETTADALVALWQPAQTAPALVIIDLRGQRPDPRTMVPFHKRGCLLVAIVGAVERASPLGQWPAWAAVLARPVKLGEVADLSQRLLAEGHPASAP